MCVRQFKVKDEKVLEAVRNTVRVAVLEGDELVNDLEDISFYDSKPVDLFFIYGSARD